MLTMHNIVQANKKRVLTRLQDNKFSQQAITCFTVDELVIKHVCVISISR